MDVQVPTKSLASLPIIDFEAIANKDVTEIQKLVQAGRTQGMFYLNLQGPRTNAVFDDIPTLFKAGNAFFSLPADCEEKTKALRTGVERGYHPSKGFEYYEIPRDEYAAGSWELPATLQPEQERIARTMETFHGALQIVLAELCASVGITIPELSDDSTTPSDTALKFVYKFPIHEPGKVINGAHTDFGLATLLWYDEETTQVPIYDENGGRTEEWLTIPVVGGSVLVNVADELAARSNGSLHSTVHRVVAPPGAKRRVTLELRTNEGVIKANIDASSIGTSVWERLNGLCPESLVRITNYSSPSAEAEPKKSVVNGKSHIDKATPEINVTNLTIIAEACPDLPSFNRNELDLARRLDNRLLDLRNAGSGAILKLHSGMCQLIVEFLGSNGFHWIHSPRIISHTVAGDKEYFHLPYFGGDAWLAQNAQYQNQMVLSTDMERVFDIGPAFRAEVKSRTSGRHLTEFTLLGTAMVLEENYYEVMDLMDSMIVFVLKGLQERKKYRDLIEIVQNHYPTAQDFRIGLDEQGKIPRISFKEAKRMLRDELGFKTEDTDDLSEEEEAALGRHFRESPYLGQTDIFTIDQYPAFCRPFNTHPSPDAPGFTNSWDTIVRGREICSGSQRIHKYEAVCKAMASRNMDPDGKEWEHYVGAFKSGMPPHGGLGLGVNRLLQGFLGLDDVRLEPTSKLPRSPSARPRPPQRPPPAPARAPALHAGPASAWSCERPRGPHMAAVPGPHAPQGLLLPPSAC
ncbi:hypothetical protein KXW95_002766 [Aspergillus fumigatus]|nr:hypothetical protein KXX27_003644 [Aspergillus fumigatus]KAH1862750.1 hypothetical protein KXW95_002766 [Aspergillus fumigatus]KAH2820291.1 hypothetical protein KXW07_005415 [Aspergillus fumigatus]